jgi:hypothetical protein
MLKGKVIYTGGTAYLGMPANPDFQQLIVKKHTTLGLTYGSSRNQIYNLLHTKKENTNGLYSCRSCGYCFLNARRKISN